MAHIKYSTVNRKHIFIQECLTLMIMITINNILNFRRVDGEHWKKKDVKIVFTQEGASKTFPGFRESTSSPP